MSILIFLILLYVGNSFTMTKLFEKAGVDPKKAWIPGVAAAEWCKIVGRKPIYALWLLVPVVNFFIYAGLCIDMIRSFGKHGFWDSVVAVIFAPLPFFQIGNDANATYGGPVLEQEKEYHLQYVEAIEKKDKLALKKLETNNPFRKSALREWAEAVIFAVFAAAFIRMFIFEAYVIPTPSMEGTLKVGDFLFVSKPSYGLRLPMTVVQFPLIHNRFSNEKGFLGRESYLESPSLPYTRIPGWESLERNKPVVFNLPVGDSVIVTPDRIWDVYQWRRNSRNANRKVEVVSRPIDKKDHYIKRCVAIAGDSIVIRGGQLYINGQAAANPEHLQYSYRVNSKTPLDMKKIAGWGVAIDELRGHDPNPAPGQYYFSLDAQQVEKIKSLSPDIAVERIQMSPAIPTYVFPNDAKVSGGWTVDDYGPIFIPKAGATVELNERSLVFYRRLIEVYEHNEFKVAGGKYYVNGQETTTYTFKQNYYWMMGDNRHNSEDSRIWGYVPADHIVGKPVLVWFSTKNGSIRNGINWDRIFLLPGNM